MKQLFSHSSECVPQRTTHNHNGDRVNSCGNNFSPSRTLAVKGQFLGRLQA